MSKRDYREMITKINDMLYTYFPCPLCWCFGYLCCIPTLGLSMCCPYICVNDAEDELKNLIRRYNRIKLNPKNLHLSLRKKCSTSWLQIDFVGPEPPKYQAPSAQGNAEYNKLLTNEVHTEPETRLEAEDFREKLSAAAGESTK